MAHSGKKSVEIITSDDKGSDELKIQNPNNSESDEEEEEVQNLHLPAPLLTPLTPPATTKKWKWGQKERGRDKQVYLYNIQCLIHHFAVPETLAEIMYVLTLTSAPELKKVASKCKTKSTNLQLNSDKPFDTFKAQILAKISQAIKPQLKIWLTTKYAAQSIVS
jgi:hypothetical protein